MKVYLIRHAMTAGNKEKRYIGARSDEPLCEEGYAQLAGRDYPTVDRIFISPMKRCLMTAQAIYPTREYTVCETLREMDFGDFEGKNYQELNGNSDYQRWVDSGCELPIPNGESKATFSKRCVEGFRWCLDQCRDEESIALVVHGGTIMAIMEAYGEPRGEYYRWQIKNGEYIILNWKMPFS